MKKTQEGHAMNATSNKDGRLSIFLHKEEAALMEKITNQLFWKVKSQEGCRKDLDGIYEWKNRYVKKR